MGKGINSREVGTMRIVGTAAKRLRRSLGRF